MRSGGMYGFSSSPLREALSRLTQEGLVVADQRRGFRAAPLSVDDFADITRLRLLLDLEALQESMELGDDEWEARAVAAFYRLQKIEERFPPSGPLALNAEWSVQHKEFHMSLISATRSVRLMELCSTLFDQAERYRRFSASHRATPRFKSAEHEAILDATIRRDTEAATLLLSRHITRTKDGVVEALCRMEAVDAEA